MTKYKSKKDFDIDPIGDEVYKLGFEEELHNAPATPGPRYISPPRRDSGELDSSHEYLADLVRKAKGIQDLEAQKSTAEKLRAIKTVRTGCDAEKFKGKRQVFGFLNWLSSMISGMFSSEPKKSTGACHIYGHVLPPPGWSGDYPHCDNCGELITSPDQIRKSTPRQ